MNLIKKVKPEVLKALSDVKVEYGASYRAIILSFKNHSEYRNLSINEVDNLISFLPDELHPRGRIDFYYGDYLLKKEYQV